jgi:hypothetical protein
MAIRNLIPTSGAQSTKAPAQTQVSVLKPGTKTAGSPFVAGSYTPAAAKAAVPAQPIIGPGGSNPVNSFAVGGGGGGAGAAATAPGGTDEDFLAGDSQYQLQLAALMKALSDEQADTGAQQAKYNTDYGDTLKNLGWQQDDPSTPDVNEGQWNFNDLNTAAGRSFNNQSSLYGTANDNLTRSLNDQLGSVNTARQSFLDDLARQQGTFASDNQNQMQQAKIEALARRANGVSLVS